MLPFADKTILVTGGARGVGRVVSSRLAAAGAHVIVNCFHSFAEGKALRDELRDRGARVDVVRGSVARREQVERMFAEVRELTDSLDGLVNNAASGAFGPVCDTDDAVIDKAFDTNLRGAWWCSRAARDLLRAGNGGAIVNLSSVGSTLVVGNYAAVGTSKAALEALTRYLAAELAAERIRVNTASGGLIDGDVAALFPHAAEMAEVVRNATPLGRLGRADELADVVLFLLSDASRWVTGQVVVADGGLSLGSAMLSAPVDRPAPAALPVPPPAPPAEPDPGPEDAIVIVGAGVVVPGADNLDEYWRVLSDGPELFVDSRPERWRAESFTAADRGAEDKSYSSRSACVVDAAQSSEPTVEYTSDWLRRAVSDAVAGVRLRAEYRLGCVFGYTPDGNQHLEEAVVVDGVLGDLAGVLREDGVPEPDVAELVERTRDTLAERYPRTGAAPRLMWPQTVGAAAVAGLHPAPAEILMVDTACSSSLYALDIGIKALQEGRQDVVLCGGSFAVGPRNSVLFSKLNGLSASGAMRPLDQDSDGVLFSDGAAVVVAKRLADARRDGDEILGYVVAVGASSDGKGKAIYAPSIGGQRRAVERAWRKAPEAAGRLSWVVAHATGTPAGDLCELSALGEEIGPGRDVCITSNKSIIGHTGWAAGVASVIHVLLAFRSGTIPPQHRFAALPARAPAATAGLRVPTAPVAWPAVGSGRVAAVSGFGFGGTNSHVLLADRALPTAEPRSGDGNGEDDELVVLAWSATFPGLADRDAVTAWLAGGPGPQSSYGPTFAGVSRTLRIPPPTQRVLDRAQLLVVACAEQLRAALGELWEARRDDTGVFLGHMGPTRSAISYAKRCYLDDVLGDGVLAPELAERVRQRVRAEIPPSTEDSFPGMMPNVIAARISNYFDLHGPNMVIDTGSGATRSAFEVARRYLAAGDVEVAIVGGVNGNATPEITRLLGRLGAPSDVREGAVLFAVTTAARARQWDAKVLGTVDPASIPDADGSGTYLGAGGAVALLRQILAPESITNLGESVGSPEPEPEPQPEPTPAVRNPIDNGAVRRHVTYWEPEPARPTLPPVPVLAADAVVVTATPDLLGGLGERPEDPLVLSSRPCADAPRRRYLPVLDAETVRAVLAAEAPEASQVRIVVDLEALHPAATAAERDWSAVADLHDLAFLAVQACSGRLDTADGSVLGLFLGGEDGSGLHPFAGLFGGLLKSAALEYPGCRVATVFTTARELAEGLGQLAEAARCTGGLPVTAYRGGERHVMGVQQVPATPGSAPPLGPDDVVVATGGGHGITAELLREVVSAYRPTVYVLGSTPLDALARDIEALGGPAALGDRAAFLRRRREADPGASVQSGNAEFERLRHAADALATLAELERRCGPGKLHYRQADVVDRERIVAVMDEVHARHGRIDLLLHAAGVNRAGALATKPLSAFRQVRAVKVGGYLNLRAALAGRPPRRWCNFGSFIGLTGQVGEADYASANDLLATAAAARRRAGGDEVTIGWTLWDEVGMGAHPVTRAFLAKSGVLTRMSTREGVAHFAAELGAADPVAAVFHLGDAERAAIESRLPGFFAPRPAARFYLDRVTHRDDRLLVAERRFDPERDGYLADHAVAGVGTLPGLFVPELAAQAALELLPGMVVTGFRHVAFERFLKLVPALTATPRRIEASVVARSADAASVLVEISGDVTAPGGRVLQRDVRHFRLTVVLADRYPAAPTWPGLGPGTGRRLPDPYHATGSPVELRGPFITTTDTRMHPLGKLARYRSPVDRAHPVFGGFGVPSLLLDGLARVAVLELVAGRYIPVAAPASIRRIDLYEPGGDAALGERYAALDLAVTPGTFNLEDAAAANRFVASHQGRIVAQMHDVRGVVLGYVDAETGAAHERGSVERLAADWQGPPAVPAVAL